MPSSVGMLVGWMGVAVKESEISAIAVSRSRVGGSVVDVLL